MIRHYIAIILAGLLLPLTLKAQTDDFENGVVSMAGKEGFTIGTKKGDFIFKPYFFFNFVCSF